MVILCRFSLSVIACTEQQDEQNRYSMAEQAINTIYGLGDQPDALCSSIIRNMTVRVFAPAAVPSREASAVEVEGNFRMDDDTDADAVEAEADVETNGGAKSDAEETQARRSHSAASNATDPSIADSFQLSQLIFVAGHCAIKQLVHLELVERDIKRRKVEEDKKKAEGISKAAGQDELDQVAGSVEDEIGDIIAVTKEQELLYGPESLLAVFGPLSVAIVSQPKLYRVRISIHNFMHKNWRYETKTEPAAEDSCYIGDE